MNSQINNHIIKNLKTYLNANFKLIGFEYQPRGDAFNSAIDDILTIKIMCRCCAKCDPCNCDKVISVVNRFGTKYEYYVETQKISVNGHFEFHQFRVFIKQ